MGSCGYFRRTATQHARLLAGLSLAALAAPAFAQTGNSSISIPATTLDAALTTLARQTGTEIISTEPGLRSVRVKPLAGKLSARAALARLLDGTGYRAVPVGGGFRVVRGQERPAPPRERPRPGPPPVDGTQADIIVTASKQRIPLLRFPGTLTVLSSLARPGLARAVPDLDGVARATPVMQNTELGVGRNKIFIRGIADSSFNGATQSTASVYFGDVQMAYSGAEPGLKLYDVQDVEVMEGPQGTLYGAGAIGGIVRLTPMPVNLAKIEGEAGGGVSATVHGQPGFDVDGHINLPIVTDTLGIRAVAYRSREGGYIDDVRRGLNDVNRTDIEGGRLAMRYAPGGGWTIDAGGLIQRIDARDAQYAEAIGPLARASLIAQPYHNQFALGRLVITKNWDSGLELISATGISDYHTADHFDATAIAAPSPPGMPAQPYDYTTNGARLLITHEMRLSRSASDGNSWVIGLTFLRNRDAEARTFGRLNNQVEIIGVTNVTQSASAFGEGTFALTRSLSATVGARFTYARIDGEPSITPRAQDFIRGRSTKRLDPTAALSWQFAPRIAAFARVQTGYRTGGLAVATGVGRVHDFNSDSIIVGEIGMRLVREAPTGIAATLSGSLARWVDIQADIINRRGAPFTTNLGNARIATIEGSIDYVPFVGLHATAAFLYTSNEVTGPLADLSVRQNRRLPETPPFAGNASLSYEWNGQGGAIWSAGARATYVGRSVLGTGDLLDISQGQYATIGLNGGWRRGGLAFALSVENLTNAAANRFAYGNPFTLISRAQTTPLRPLTVRLGVSRSW